ncbi:MAG: rhamnogalacturonan acetylesterase [Clostridiales bacterium]|nr:rhamnogalacturonan acetylesterase [Clostridiales bacterium]
MNILLAGDSTVTDRGTVETYDPKVCYTGWGQILPRYIKNGAMVRNFAISGYTVETFRTEGKYAELCSHLGAGDYILMQFGHNDQKRPHLRENGGYTDALVTYIHEIRAMQGCPILVTPVARNSWRGDNDQYSDLLLPYAEAMKKAAAQYDVPLIDLHEDTVNWTKSLGREGAKRFYHPGDFTHTNDYGADQWVRFLLDGMLASSDPRIDFLKMQILPKDEWQPLLFAQDDQFVCHWTAAPAPRVDFRAWNNDEILTHADALDMAMQGYGYFVALDVEAVGTKAALAAASENGYLPPSFPQDEASFSSQILAADFEALLWLACKSRNRMPQIVSPKQNADGTITGKHAVAYALELERRATGANLTVLSNEETPQGS